MALLRKAEDRVFWFMSELGARVVAETGIPSDRYHLGKLILKSLKDAPDFILQIDAATEEAEDFKSVLKRSVQCASAFNMLGLSVGDNIVLLAPNHIDLTIPYYAALFLGIGIAPVDAYLNVGELQCLFAMMEPKVVFCQNERVSYVKEALKLHNFDATVVSFNESDDCIEFSNFLEMYGRDVNVDTFKASDFDPADTISILTSTSGTTGLPKAALLTHKNIMFSLPNFWLNNTQFPTPTRSVLIVSPLQWMTASIHFLGSAILRYTRVQSSVGITPENFIDILQKYKPTNMTISPPLLTTLTKPENAAKLDMSSFEIIFVAGSAVSKELLQTVRKLAPKLFLTPSFGMSEIGGMAFFDQHCAPGSVGRPVGIFDYRLVNPDTETDVTEPHVNGELWLRGPSICKQYYKQPEVTKECFVEDGWFRTGDIFYRDEHYFFYYVERLKLLLKYRNHQISPLELETVIRQHPGVLDVVVTGLPDKEHGDLPVACIIPHSGYEISTQEIKDLVKNTLTDTKQLRGGVVFMKEFPMTATTKVDRRRLKEMMLTVIRE